LRRPRTQLAAQLSAGDLLLDSQTQEVQRAHKKIYLRLRRL
jgi:hypothetical protein